MKYKLFGKSGLRVAELCLGTMTFGTDWGWGADFDTSKAIFEAYANAGGNFIDTANRYTEGASERYVGELIASDRDHFVLATKYTLYDRRDDVNFSGNHRKNLLRSVEASLNRLNTDYIDVLWLHAWDFTTPEEEILRGLDDLVRAGKVHYIGISDVPAWIVARSNAIAELRGWTAFTGLQIQYSLIQRTPERELLPMAKSLDIAVTPWAPLAAGLLTGKYLEKEAKGRLAGNEKHLNERNMSIARTVVEVADQLGTSPAQVAINWTRQRNQVVIPIIGATKVAQIEDSLGAVSFEIPEEMMQRLNEVSAIELGFPHDFLQSEGVLDVIYGGAYSKIQNHRSK
jgi:aryl-alcohol dehydrogenase-like predicted oxidoreductase